MDFVCLLIETFTGIVVLVLSLFSEDKTSIKSSCFINYNFKPNILLQVTYNSKSIKVPCHFVIFCLNW
jgi:hypothetical protein